MQTDSYSISRPHYPATTWLLGVVILIGLIVLGIAAYNAFIQVMDSSLQAGLAAALIEISAIVEALSFIRGRNWIGGAGLLISLVVSGTYNYIQAETTGRAHGVESLWQLVPLAFGPLVALAFLSLTLGQELRQHETRVSVWQVERAAWLESQKTARLESAERARKEEIEREEAERKTRKEIELARIEAETKANLARIRAEGRRKDQEALRNETETFRKVSGSDWRSLPEEDRRLIAGMNTTEIAQTYQVSDRTARNWKSKAMLNKE